MQRNNILNAKINKQKFIVNTSSQKHTQPHSIYQTCGTYPLNHVGGLCQQATQVLYVANLPPNFTNQQLKQHFQKYGKLFQASIIIDAKTRKQYAFVQFETLAQSSRAKNQMNNREVQGRKLIVEFKRNAKSKYINEHLNNCTIHNKQKENTFVQQNIMNTQSNFTTKSTQAKSIDLKPYQKLLSTSEYHSKFNQSKLAYKQKSSKDIVSQILGLNTEKKQKQMAKQEKNNNNNQRLKRILYEQKMKTKKLLEQGQLQKIFQEQIQQSSDQTVKKYSKNTYKKIPSAQQEDQIKDQSTRSSTKPVISIQYKSKNKPISGSRQRSRKKKYMKREYQRRYDERKNSRKYKRRSYSSSSSSSSSSSQSSSSSSVSYSSSQQIPKGQNLRKVQQNFNINLFKQYQQAQKELAMKYSSVYQKSNFLMNHQFVSRKQHEELQVKFLQKSNLIQNLHQRIKLLESFITLQNTNHCKNKNLSLINKYSKS